ncbi:hypothetical protein [Acinetobacter sp. ANC 4648]|uniref:putative pilus system protein FilF n=1 Tax=Acinetobacter sp. ANC 4648 TaxID=1977875 RepID=UPI000A32E547|nr:hypothetical protein [Acinetobacter sp. ANC 4648]OTG79820.1 hypothetical protein B9T27_14170 [Acinetobacter sp. ANC 4648]
MKNKFIIPFALTGLVAALSGCGGESAVIHEDPNKGIVTSTNGCLPTAEKCQSFVVDYPIEGLNFDCSSDQKNHFITEMVQNVAIGGCGVGDKVNFYIQGSETSKKITLGSVDLSKLNPLKVTAQPTQIGLIDIATAMTGKAPVSMSMSDDTFKVMVGLTRIFQAVAVTQDTNLVGDIQPLELSKQFKNNLSKIESSVDVGNFLDGSYVNILQPWLNVNLVSETAAQQVAEQLINLANVNIYTANFLAVSGPNVDLGGFYGSSPSGKEAIANLYLLTTRQGYTTGYAVQWMGTPITTGDQVISSIARINLLTQVAPEKLDADAQSKWIDPFSKRISAPFKLHSANNLANNLEIFQGTLFNGTTIPGTEFMYKRVTGDTKPPVDPSVYGKWKQNIENDQFTGSIDVYKTNPATYLDKRVFQTVNTVKTGEQYIFPLYANLIFSFEDKTLPKVKLGIVVDEKGDIRTNIGADATSTDLSSATCSDVNPTTYKDTASGVQQYRIGTTGAANYDNSDKSLTLRMILSNPVFGNLDGVLVGLNESLMFLPQTGSGDVPSFTSGGVRMNLQNLIVDKSTAHGINITGWNGQYATEAQWGNLQAISQSIFNSANKDKANQAQLDLAKRSSGTINIELPSCYTLKTK